MKKLFVYHIPEMDDVEILSGIAYGAEKNSALTLDICYPPEFDKKKKYPAVLLISGGVGDSVKFSPNFKYIFLSWGKLLAVNGLIAVHFIWRYKHKDDISEMLKYIAENDIKMNIDSKRICAFSFSRGVNISFGEMITNKYCLIKSMVVYYGKIPEDIFNKGNVPLPPLLIAMAGKDRHFAVDCNEKFIESARSCDNKINLLFHETGMHAFDIQNNNDRTREIIIKTVKFIKENT